MPPPDLSAALREAVVHVAGRGSRIAIAFSGGIDSVVLLDLLSALREDLALTLVAIHVHHGLSPNADNWQAFCERECGRRQIEFETERLRLDPAARGGLEAIARRGRYATLEAIAARRGISTVALAHHLDDQAETVLLQALRGASPHGLAAMPSLRVSPNGVRLWRPLLQVARRDIDSYAATRNLEWIVDETNADMRFRRNFIRARIFPEIEREFPDYRTALARAAKRAAETADLNDTLGAIDAEACASDDRVPGLRVDRLRELGPLRARNAIRAGIAARGIALPDVDRLDEFVHQALTARRDRHPELPLDSSTTLWGTGRSVVILTSRACPTFHVTWQGERRLALPHGTLGFTSTRGAGISLQRMRAALCEVRCRTGGERLRSAFDGPTRTLKYLFQEAAIPAPLRRSWPLLLGDGDLIAIPGIAIAAEWQCAPADDGCTVTWEPAEPR